MKKLIVLALVVSNITLASDPDNVYLKKGDPAPYELIGMPLPRAERVRLLDIDYSTLQKRYDLSVQDNSLYAQRVENMKTEVSDLREQVSKKTTFWDSLGMFLLGSGVTVLITYGVKSATR